MDHPFFEALRFVRNEDRLTRLKESRAPEQMIIDAESRLVTIWQKLNSDARIWLEEARDYFLFELNRTKAVDASSLGKLRKFLEDTLAYMEEERLKRWGIDGSGTSDYELAGEDDFKVALANLRLALSINDTPGAANELQKVLGTVRANVILSEEGLVLFDYIFAYLVGWIGKQKICVIRTTERTRNEKMVAEAVKSGNASLFVAVVVVFFLEANSQLAKLPPAPSLPIGIVFT